MALRIVSWLRHEKPEELPEPEEVVAEALDLERQLAAGRPIAA
jgi:hypothetical protein